MSKMTKRIYFTESYQQEFTATVVATSEQAGRQLIQLERTCFYPTSGGQPFDRGVLAGLPVVDVFVDENDQIQHAVEVETGLQLPLVGEDVSGAIDWVRRYDFMQQHSGQHLLSQVFFENLGVETVSVHFGEVESTLDLSIEELSLSQLAEIEQYANEMAYRALPIHAYFVEEEALSTVPLRRPPKVTGTIRIVEIARYDYSACGGTHVRTTAELAPLKITKLERNRNQVRLTFLCGQRAFSDYAKKHQLIADAAALFSNEPQQVPALIERNLALLKEKDRLLEEYQSQLVLYEAQKLIGNAQNIGGAEVVQYTSEKINPSQLKALAAELQTSQNVIALLASTAQERVTICFACNAELAEQRKLNMGQILRSALQPVQGKGGGKADFAQGGGISSTDMAQVFTLALQELHELLND